MSALLRFESVALRRGGRLLFDGLDLELGAGKALQVAGPNGSGKSSLIRLAAGLLRAEQGQVERSQLAMADDALPLDRELTLKRALNFWGGDVDMAMERLGLSHLAQVPVRLLSSGQQKRASLSRVAASGISLTRNPLCSCAASVLVHGMLKTESYSGVIRPTETTGGR